MITSASPSGLTKAGWVNWNFVRGRNPEGAGEGCFRGLYEVSLALVGVEPPRLDSNNSISLSGMQQFSVDRRRFSYFQVYAFVINKICLMAVILRRSSANTLTPSLLRWKPILPK